MPPKKLRAHVRYPQKNPAVPAACRVGPAAKTEGWARERYLREGYVKRIHVNRGLIAANRKDGGCRPVMTVQTSVGPVPTRKVTVVCDCGRQVGVFDQGARQLSCGARLYFETKAEIEIE